MMESEEAGATAGQENQEDPEMKKKKLEAILGKVNDALGRFCTTSFLLASTRMYQASVLSNAINTYQQQQEKILGNAENRTRGSWERSKHATLCHAECKNWPMTKQSFNPT